MTNQELDILNPEFIANAEKLLGSFLHKTLKECEALGLIRLNSFTLTTDGEILFGSVRS